MRKMPRLGCVLLAILVSGQAVFAEEVKPVSGLEVHGFLDGRLDSAGDAELSHGWLRVTGSVADGAQVDVAFDPISKKVPVRQVSAVFGPAGGAYAVRVGRIPTAFALAIPSPATEKITGGPIAASEFATFFGLGVEASARLGTMTVRASALSDGGLGHELNDGMFGISWKPHRESDTTVELVADASSQPSGLRKRGLVHARLGELWGAFVDLTGVMQQWHEEHSWGLSNLVGVEATKHLEVSAGFDVLQRPHAEQERLVRGEVTLISFAHSLRTSALVQWDSATRHTHGDLRVQFMF